VVSEDIIEKNTRRFDPLAGGVALGNPHLTRQMRWTPSHSGELCGLSGCLELVGHPGTLHRAAGGVTFKVTDSPDRLLPGRRTR
jgi:hypothetical protein